LSVAAHAGLGPGRPNSFNFVPVRDVLRARGDACPLRAAPERIAEVLGRTGRDRALFLRLPDRMRLFSTATTDFDDAEIAAVRRETGQLYADISRKVAPDDFARDLVKLELSGECLACEQQSVCAGCHVSVKADVFGRDDARVRELLRALSGSVLDVGCGEGPYLGELRTNDVHYLGIDPDAQRIELLRARHGWAEFRVGTLDSLARDARTFSHVLLLRSFNHLPDPDRDLRSAIELLAPGGTLLVVDNVAFGLVRSREHAARAEQSGALFEHFRNDCAERAAERLAGYGLELLERRDVSPETSNQWLLHYRKPNS
jgi:SAM-dependent methyltransferase